MLQAVFSAEIFEVPSKSGPKMVVLEEKGVVNVKFCFFCILKKANLCVKLRLLTYFASMSVVASWLYR